MKNQIKKLLLLALVSSFVFVFSCGETDTEDPLPAKPLVSVDLFVNETEVTSATSAQIGDEVTLDLAVEAEGKFNVFRVYVKEGTDLIFTYELPRTNITGVTDFTDFSLNDVTLFTIPDSLESTELYISWEVVDDENQVTSSSSDFHITVIAGVYSYETVLIGGFNNETLGSSYDAIGDSVYYASNLRNSATNQAKIDFVYYFANTPQRTIAAPDNAEAQTTWEAQNTSAWPFGTTENATRFVEAASSFDFASAKSAELGSAFGEVAGESRITNLEVGDVIIFKTVQSKGSKIGAFKVTAVDGNSTGSITLSVKVQK